MSKKERERNEARDHLLNTLGIKPGDTLKTILRSVSASGMNRKISVIYNGENISWHICKLLGCKPVEKYGHWAISRSGCGMDMGFDLVYSIGWELWPEGTREPHGTRNGKPDSEPGYALKQRWL
jgi:hypothetical protein